MATLKIPVTKAGRTLDVDTDALPEESYRIALEEGLKVLLNKGMSKITTKGLEGSDLERPRKRPSPRAPRTSKPAWLARSSAAVPLPRMRLALRCPAWL